MITVICWKWKGWRGNTYTRHHVHALRNMVKRHLSEPHRFVCITDDPHRLDCESLPLPPNPEGLDAEVMHVPNCYRRMWAFSDEARAVLGSRVLSIDLDCIITGTLDPLLVDNVPFMILKGYVAPYNGSIWYVEPGAHPEVWYDINQRNIDIAQDDIKGYGSDQVWMSHKLKGAPTWSSSDGIHQYTRTVDCNEPPDGARIIFFAGSKKPWTSGMYDRYVKESQP